MSCRGATLRRAAVWGGGWSGRGAHLGGLYGGGRASSGATFAREASQAPTDAAAAGPLAAAGLALLTAFASSRGPNGSLHLGFAMKPTQLETLSQDELKRQAGYKAVDDYVRSGMVVGLGTGSTAAFAVERVGQKLAAGQLKGIVAIPTSERTKEQALRLGIPLATLDSHSQLDVAIDGADAVDPKLNLIKGGGGAHFREKIVEAAAKQFIVIVDESKLCKGLGPSFPLPVEIVPFCHEHTMRTIEALPALSGCKAVLRLGSAANNKPDGDRPAVTDNGNYVVDLHFMKPIQDPVAAATQLKQTIGVVEHGLFIGMTTAAIVAGSDGVRKLNP